MKKSIVIPISPDMTEESVKKLCEHYDCEAEKLTSTNWKITTKDPSNFFWLGINWYKPINNN